MEEQIEQRRTARFSCESPIVCSSLNGKRVYPARTVNHCDSGISFITQTPLKSGMTIFFRADIRTQKRIATQPGRTMRGTGLVNIRWCHPLDSRDPVSYCVGAEYAEPYP
jgi:hypothetical protein